MLFCRIPLGRRFLFFIYVLSVTKHNDPSLRLFEGGTRDWSCSVVLGDRNVMYLMFLTGILENSL